MRPVSRKHHIDFAAGLYIGITFIVGLGAFYSQNNLLYVVFGLAVSAMVVSGLCSGAMLMGVRARRLPIPTGTAGQPAVIEYRIERRGRILPAFALDVSEIHSRGAAWRGRITPPLAFAPLVHRRGRVTVSAVVTPLRRGEARLSGMRVGSRFPFGVMRKSLRFEQEGAMLVRPAPLSPPPGVLDDALARRSRVLGARRAAAQGAEPEFYALREYSPGDSPRQIAWRASARRGELVVRESAASARWSVWLVLALLDDDPEGHNETVISIAAGVIELARARAIRLGLAIPGVGHTRWPRALTGVANPGEALLDDLARLDTSVIDTGAQAAWTPHSDDGVILVCAPGAALPAVGGACVRVDAFAQGDAP